MHVAAKNWVEKQVSLFAEENKNKLFRRYVRLAGYFVVYGKK